MGLLLVLLACMTDGREEETRRTLHNAARCEHMPCYCTCILRVLLLLHGWLLSVEIGVDVHM